MKSRNTTLDDIASVVGFSATLRLSGWFGDENNCYVPPVAEEGQLLVKLIGLSAAKRLSAAFPGETLGIPRCQAYEMDLKTRQIAEMLTKGFSTRQVSGYMRMTERRVQQICRELEVAGLMQPIGSPTKTLVRMRHKKLGRKEGVK